MFITYIIFAIIFAFLGYVSYTKSSSRNLFVALTHKEIFAAIIISVIFGFFWPLFILFMAIRELVIL